MSVLFTPRVEDYLLTLVTKLYEKEYFSYLENAENYVEDIVFEIKNNIYMKPKKKAPPRFRKYGKNLYYVIYRKSKRTTWYIFFTIHGQEQNNYLVSYITNNHVSAQHIRGL